MEMYTIYTMQEGFKYIKSACREQKRRTVRPNLIYILGVHTLTFQDY